jgi:hypothetical protein
MANLGFWDKSVSLTLLTDFPYYCYSNGGGLLSTYFTKHDAQWITDLTLQQSQKAGMPSPFFRQRNKGSESKHEEPDQNHTPTVKSHFQTHTWTTQRPPLVPAQIFLHAFTQPYWLIASSCIPVGAVLSGKSGGQVPRWCLVIKTELPKTIHQMIQSLSLLVDDFSVVGQCVEQCLPLWHKQAPIGRIKHEWFKKEPL